MAKKKEAKIVKEKNEEGIVDAFLKGVSYGTGVLARKAADIGKVGETKPWKEVASKTGDLYKKVNTNTAVMFKQAKKTVKESIRDMKKSFKEGVDSAAEETTKSKAINASSAPEQPSVNTEIKEKEIPLNQEIPSPTKKKGEIKEKSKGVSGQNKTISAPVLEQPSDNVKIKAAIEEITKKQKAPSSATKKVKKAAVKKNTSVPADLEKVIDNDTKDTKEI